MDPMEQEPPTVRWLRPFAQVRPGEVRVLLGSAAAYFFLLAGWYVLRPVRETMGLQGGAKELPWLWQGTIVVALILNPFWSALVARMPRRRLFPLAVQALVVLLLAFLAGRLVLTGSAAIWVARAFYMIVSVFNILLVSCLYGQLADAMTSGQGKRLLAFVTAGGSVGALVGSSLTAFVAAHMTPELAVLPAIVLLECSAVLMLTSIRPGSTKPPVRVDGTTGGKDDPVGGGAWEGFRRVAGVPYLRGIALFTMLQTLAVSYLYFIQGALIESWSADTGDQTTAFALIDFSTSAITLALPTLVTPRLVRHLPLGVVLSLIPALAFVGFVALAVSPTLMVLGPFMVMLRAGRYGVVRPAREMLWTIVPSTDAYKAKNLIDVAVYRGGDSLAGWVRIGLGAFGLSSASMAAASAPQVLPWIAIGLYLGRRFTRRTAET
jgi:AAA family ATP:ADP antiporter